MKSKILYFLFAAVGAVLVFAADGYTHSSYCPGTTTIDCSKCHGVDYCGQCPSDPICNQTPTCSDSDNDGYGNPGDASCDNGAAEDCNDSNRAINPGAAEDCSDGIDNDCNGLVDNQDPNAINCPPACTDNDKDNYASNGGLCGQVDCDDTNASVNPGEYEVCDDGIDNDCDNQIDCDDSACQGDPACLAESCTDYIDRRSCKADPRCNWSGKEKSCFDVADVTVCSDFSGDQDACEANGCRWNRRKGTCR